METLFGFADEAKDKQLKSAVGNGGDKKAEVAPEKKGEVKIEEKPYKVFERDFSVKDSEIVDYYRTRFKIMAMRFKLCGRVTSEGKYIIPNEVKIDLTNIEKGIDEIKEDCYKATTIYMKKEFNFLVRIEILPENKAKATLLLSEFVGDFLEEEYITTPIAAFVDDYDEDFRVKVRKAFNLVDVVERIDDFSVSTLAVVMQDYFDMELVVGELYDMASQIYLLRMLKFLETCGEKGGKILKRYQELIAGKDIETDEKFRYIRYKALLDRAIDENGGLESLEGNAEEKKSILKDINSTVKAIQTAAKNNEIEGEIPKKGAVAGGKPAGKGNKPSKKVEKSKPKGGKKKKGDKKDEKKKKKGDGVYVEEIEKIYAHPAPSPIIIQKEPDEPVKDIAREKKPAPAEIKPAPKIELVEEEIELVSETFFVGGSEPQEDLLNEEGGANAGKQVIYEKNQPEISQPYEQENKEVSVIYEEHKETEIQINESDDEIERE